ncbi:hypothetical protein Tco_0458865 [Tanacetum coccineum]
MDDPNITMEECIKLEEEKARKHGKVFNWETAKYGRIWYDEDVHDLRSIENEFPAITFNNSLKSGEALSCEPTVSSLNDEMSLKFHLTILMMKITWEITVVILVRDRCPRGKGNLPRLPIRTNIVRLATPSIGIPTGAVTPNRSIHNIRVHSQCK